MASGRNSCVKAVIQSRELREVKLSDRSKRRRAHPRTRHPSFDRHYQLPLGACGVDVGVGAFLPPPTNCRSSDDSGVGRLVICVAGTIVAVDGLIWVMWAACMLVSWRLLTYTNHVYRPDSIRLYIRA
jgi:hypothetical protein